MADRIDLGLLFGIVNTLALLVMSLAAAYFFLALTMGLRQLRRHRTAVAFQATVAYGHPFIPLSQTVAVEPNRWSLYFVIPCLNEEAVIGATVSGLIAPDGWDSQVLVIDDGSDDGTTACARSAGGSRVTVLRRELPQARLGKGAALNAGLSHILDDIRHRDLDPARVLIVVMDADGRLSDGAIHEVLPLFGDPQVGGAMLAVRIRNRSHNALLKFQDHQFWTLSALTQFGRISTDTVSLGGNGQFTRLSALLEIGEQPWTSSLTEDLDLSISLSVRGWRTTSTPRAAVDQQGVESLRALLRQRTRWYQGHMASGRRVPEILRSNKLGTASAIEMVLYLAVPWLFDLPWSILYHVILIETALLMSGGALFASTGWMLALELTFWYLLGFWPALVTTILAKRRDPSHTWRHALLLGHCFVLTNYMSYACAWRALFRMIRGQRGWAKTDRVAEASSPPERVAAQ